MSHLRRGVIVTTAMIAGTVCCAEETPQDDGERSTVLPHFGLTQIYQQNVHGGLSTSEPDGRYAGSYDLEGTFDLESLAGLNGARLYVLVEGGWPETGSIDPVSVGSFFGVNADTIEGQWARLSELWFEQSFAGGSLLWRAGKLDLTGGFQHRGCEVAFDGSRYANDETSQFLNGALVNNPTIPFPGLTLGSALFAGLSENCHIGLAVATRESGDAGDTFASWGSTGNGFFCVVEGGYGPGLSTQRHPLAGDYHVGLWWGQQRDGESPRRNQRGLYVSASQPLFSNLDRSPDGGLGLFVRAGWTEGDDVAWDNFWSIGLQYQGLWAPDGSDVLGLGLAQGTFMDSEDPQAPRGSESALELYYSVPVNEWMRISPNVQYVANPGGKTVGRDALVVGLRLQILLE